MTPAPTEFGPYRLEYGLGTGGSGTVFAARHVRLGRLVAVKVVPSPPPAARERVLREARVQAQLHHRNIVAVHDVIEQGADIAIVMDLVDGPDLGAWLRQQPPLSDRLAVFHQVLAGVGAAHAKGLVHRDLKPANVLINVEGGTPTARVADFGLVFALGDLTPRITQSGVILGTPPYMAPEQFHDAKAVDERADIFALGCILYELACGRMAFPQTDFVRLVMAVDHEDYTDPHSLNSTLAPAFVRVIRDCLRVDRTLRPGSCAELADRLRGAGGEASESPPTCVPAEPPTGPDASLTPPRQGRGWSLGIFASTLAVATAALVVWAGPAEPQAADEPGPAAEGAAAPEAGSGSAEAAPPPALAIEPSPTPPAPAPPTPVPSGRVRFEGDATAIWLQRGRTRYSAGAVPAGTYEVWASFGGREPYVASIVEVSAGKSQKLRCTAAFKFCRLE